MNKEDYKNIINEKLDNNAKKIILNQLENYYNTKNQYQQPTSPYHIGDKVFLKKGTLLHGTYKNLDGLKEIVQDGLISSWFIEGRGTKYPSSVGVWNLKKDYFLKDYIDHYSGGTMKYFNQLDDNGETEVISNSDMPNILNHIKEKNYLVWHLEQTKEARFMPSLVQDKVQIGIIFNGDNNYTKELLKGDVLNPENINDKDVEPFVSPDYYNRFIIDRKNKDDFFTDRESAILFGIPSNLIESILVGRDYEHSPETLDTIKQLLPNCYICNLDGIVIK